MISSQWLSELRRLWPSAPWRVACELYPYQIPTLCLNSIVIPLRFHCVKGVSVFRCYLPPALLAEWPGSCTNHKGNTGVERTLNKSQHRELTQDRNSLLPGTEVATFGSRVRRSANWAIPTCRIFTYHQPQRYTSGLTGRTTVVWLWWYNIHSCWKMKTIIYLLTPIT